MDYLYFDIECADGSRMCSFGYVVTDAEFNIKDKRDVLIDPQCEFRLGKHRKQPYINLAYSEDEFYDSPSFEELYDEIRGLLLCKDRVVLGHAIESDVEFLDKACKRYNKPLINVAVYDTQKIYERFTQSGNVKALEKIMEELGVNIERLCAHKSCDDAEMSMLTMREICKLSGHGIDEQLRSAKKYVVDRHHMEIVYRCRQIRRLMQNVKRNAHNSERKKICMPDIIERVKINKTREVLHAIYNAGYGFSFDGEKCDYYVGNPPKKPIDDCEIQYIDYDTLSEMLGVKVSPNGDVEYIEKRSAGNSLREFFENAAKSKKQNKHRRINKK